MSFLTNLDFWFTTLRCTTPVLFATMAALIASRSGMLNLGLEGAMTVAALCGVLGSGFTGSLFAGALCLLPVFHHRRQKCQQFPGLRGVSGI